ncbi:hypothetical protein V6N13_094081 [Hibiscus sabdariffa]|uniref:Uncharacterized protein n=1 Tax=Hibiscus sabdariffa TaxID=183260 RepID=A0ABR2BKF9_9ROSI
MIGITKGPSYASCLAVCGKDLGRTASSFKGFSDWQRDLCLTLGLQVIGETILCRLYISSDDEKDSENPWNEGTSRRDVQSKISNIREGLNRELCPFFINSKIVHFPTLVKEVRSVAATLNKPPVIRTTPPEEYRREVESKASVNFLVNIEENEETDPTFKASQISSEICV